MDVGELLAFKVIKGAAEYSFNLQPFIEQLGLMFLIIFSLKAPQNAPWTTMMMLLKL